MARCAMTGRAATTHSAATSSTSPNRFITIPPGEKGVLRVLGPSKQAPLLEIAPQKSSLGGSSPPCHDAHNVRWHFKKGPHHTQPGHLAARLGRHLYLSPQGAKPGRWVGVSYG